MTLFGTSGIRGSGDKFFTNEFCFHISVSFAKFLSLHNLAGPISIGMDPRGSSPRIKTAVIKGLRFTKREIFDHGTIPTPATCYALKSLSHAGAIMITGSHISSDLNGLKFFVNGGEILKKDENAIEEIYSQVKQTISNISVSDQEFHPTQRGRELYEEMLINLSQSKIKSKIILDCGNGTQSEIMPEVLYELGLKPVLKNTNIQREFIARDTEVDGVLDQLVQEVKLKSADIGIAYDADGDRAAFIDHLGRIVPGDYIGAILAKHLSANTVVTTISASQVIDKIGKKVYRTQVGSPFVIAKMKETNAEFGFEPSGGCIHPETIYTRDGASTSVKILNLLVGASLAQLYDDLPKFYITRTKVDCPKDLNQVILNKAKTHYKSAKFDETDGLKIWTSPDEWILLRPSGNAPEFRVSVESPSLSTTQRLGQDALEFVKHIISNS